MKAGSPVCLLAALWIAAAVDARAAAPAVAPRHTKAPVPLPGVTQTGLTRPERPPAERARVSGPQLTLDQYIGQRAGQIQQLNQRVLEKYQRLLRVTSSDESARADLHFRIAELYAEQERHFRFLARALDQKIFEAAAAGKPDLQRQQKGHEQEEQRWRRLALESYLAAAQYPRYERMDHVLYRLATLLQDGGHQERAREFYLRLIRDYPNSRYIPDAYLTFAQFYFDQGEVHAARKFYDKVAQFPRSPVFGYALYKRAWCDINLNDFKGALATFLQVIQLAQAGKAGGDRLAGAALERAAKTDAVKAYARTPDASADRAWEFCARVGGAMAPRMMELLAEIYWDQGMFVDSTKVYHRMMSLDPGSSRLCAWQTKVVRNTQSSGAKRDQVQELRRLGVVYDQVRDKRSLAGDALEECRAALHDTVRELAQVWHQEALKTKNPETFLLVRDLYQDYLQRFASAKQDSRLRFFYGEVLWETRAWEEAAREYTRVVRADPRGPYAREAAWAAVLAWKNALDIEDTGRGPEPAAPGERNLAPRPLPPTHRKLLAAIDTFVGLAPQAPELPRLRYNRARLYYEHNQFEAAARAFAEVVEKHTQDELAIYAAHLLLDTLGILDRHREVLRWIDRFLVQPRFREDVEFARQVTSIRSDGLVREAKLQEQGRRFRACGQLMLQAADTLPEHPRHAERLHDAASCFQRARLIGQAVSARNQLVEQHPDDPLAQRAVLDLAGSYQQIAVYDQAARHYEQFASRFPGEARAPEALGNAYQFRAALGDLPRALADMKAFIRLYGVKRPAQAAEVFFQMGEIYEKQNQGDKLAEHFETYLRQWASHGSIDKRIVAHFKLGEHHWQSACPQPTVEGACVKVERAGTSGRQRVFDALNRQSRTGKRKIKERDSNQCGPLTSSRVTPIARTRGPAQRGQQHFAEVLRLFADGAVLHKLVGGPEQAARAALVQSAAAGAVFYQGERAYEAFLAVTFPAGLELQPPSRFMTARRAAAVQKKYGAEVRVLKRYLDGKSRLADSLAGPSAQRKGFYDRVMDFKVADWTIAASARIGQIWASFADQLHTAPIPRWLNSDDGSGRSPRDVYCDQLDDVAGPLEEKAEQGYQLCLRAAQEQSRFDSWSNLCEAELSHLHPSDFPVAAEIRPQPGYAPRFMFPAGVVRELTRGPLELPAPADESRGAEVAGAAP
jgi:tetratricopeptide (TPR) repeat protein